MSEVHFEQRSVRFSGSAHKAASPSKDTRTGCYPAWIKILFYGGIALIIVSVLSIVASVFVRSMPGVDILSLGILAGLAALYVVATFGPRYRATK